MNPKNKFWWFAGVSVSIALTIVVTIVVLMWKEFLPEQKAILLSILRQYFGYIFGCVFILMASLVFGLDAIVHNYVIPINKLIEETTLINTVNPSHRIQIEGSRACIRLADIINQVADRYGDLQENVEQKIKVAKAQTEDEKSVLATFMAELPEGVVICNAEGQILLYNKQAKQFLEYGTEDIECPDGQNVPNVDCQFIGLGRSVFGVIDKNIIVHALDEIAGKLKREEEHAASCFVVAGESSRLLRTEAVPVLNQEKQFTGFILILNDITQQLETDNQVDCLLQSYTRGTRSSLASIRAAIEAIFEYPDMDVSQLNVFSKIIYDESVILSDFLNKTQADYSWEMKTPWPLVRITDKYLADSIRRKAEEKLGITILMEKTGEENWVKVDTYSIGLAMIFLADQLKNIIGIRKFTCSTEKEGKFVCLDLIWEGSPVRIEILREWEKQLLTVGTEKIPLTLKEVVGHHEAEIWSHSCGKSDKETGFFGKTRFLKSRDKSYLRLLLPVAETVEPNTIRSIMVLSESRPEFYDFDLFDQPGQTPEADNRPLTELSYTVFDTETTGLNPEEDEIISIGAVRIVNGNLLREEIFDQLIDPRRPVPPESVKIHGIQPEMVKGQPFIDTTLPLFHRFAEDTILVAHNAAFDMRMLEMKEVQTGIKFINPVLDTLLLSAVIHPAQENHNMELIAKRLGISIVGRHTALGDAIATGEIFLKLVSLLENNGIRTMKQARLASQKTYYARLKY